MLLLCGFFACGLWQRARIDAGDEGAIIRMLFVPSVEQGTLVRRGDELARFIREDSGLILRSEVPTSYAAVIQALGSSQADVAWMPAFLLRGGERPLRLPGPAPGGAGGRPLRHRGGARRRHPGGTGGDCDLRGRNFCIACAGTSSNDPVWPRNREPHPGQVVFGPRF